MKFFSVVFLYGLAFSSLTIVTSEPPAGEQQTCVRNPLDSLSSGHDHVVPLAERETPQRPSLEDQVRTMHTALTKKANSLSSVKYNNALVLLVEEGNRLIQHPATQDDCQEYLNKAAALLSQMVAASTQKMKNRAVNSKGTKPPAKHSC